ncbi:MAG: polysaccharide biosynthesis/export family protein [Gammaproteobacteria bacterium]|jgi:polysaccharide export outer membrane protein|nr:sugar ABC transporter substrate-binding protein [Chromatiales bacterium]MDP6096912.1 polysaccharide biosynthesis/export family protein [Gammaproteobacteria bacterium]MDP7269750.1 polysaccharide biosynthesis/export family protein [Gammaproteobacteria bacterium]HJP03572.1 XrtA/PEP-CTERM system exopolysaccharide export protein [Gammaproteobacteria bacterium]
MLRIFQLVVIASLCACTSQWSEPTDIVGDSVIQEYRIGVGDIISIDVWGNPNLSTEVPVRPDGMISMPLLGDVRAGSLTAEELSASITQGLSKDIRNPEVVVILAELHSHEYLTRVRVTGAVVDTISINHRQGMTVLDAILEAGGVTEFASPNKTTLFRKKDGDTLQLRVQLNHIMKRGDLSTNYELSPGDIISVPERLF